MGADDDVQHLARVVELTFDTYGVGLGTHIDSTVCHVLVLSRDGRCYLSRTQVVRLHLLRIEIDVDFSFGSTRDTYRSDALDAGKRIGYVVGEYLVECLPGFLCLY